MKRILLFFTVFSLAMSLGAQSLAELAKREKARRESLKGQHAVVVRNADLLKVQKAPAVQIATYEPGTTDETEATEDLDFEPATVSGEIGPGTSPSGSGAPSSRRIVPTVVPSGPPIMDEADSGREGGNGTLDAQLKSSKDLVDLLTTKMNALRQQFEAQDSMVPGYVIQQQLDETSQRLLKAQAQQARIEAQIAKKAAAGKAPGEIER